MNCAHLTQNRDTNCACSFLERLHCRCNDAFREPGSEKSRRVERPLQSMGNGQICAHFFFGIPLHTQPADMGVLRAVRSELCVHSVVRPNFGSYI